MPSAIRYRDMGGEREMGRRGDGWGVLSCHRRTWVLLISLPYIHISRKLVLNKVNYPE